MAFRFVYPSGIYLVLPNPSAVNGIFKRSFINNFRHWTKRPAAFDPSGNSTWCKTTIFAQFLSLVSIFL
jgi:hypothetical protein